MASSTDLVINIVGNAKSAVDALDNFGSKASETSSKWQAAKVGITLASAAVVAGVTKFAKDSIDAYSEAEDQQVQLERAYEKFPAIASVNIDALRALNSEVQAKTGFDDDALAASEATLAQYGLTGEQIKQLTPLMADYAAKTGKDVGAAAADMGKALIGQGRALKDVGVDFKDAGSTGANFDQLVKGLDSTVGGFGATMGKTASGQMKILSTEFENLQETVGEMLLPALTNLVSAGVQVTKWMSDNPTIVQAIAVAVGVLTVAIVAANVAIWAMNTALLANPITWIVLAVIALIGAIVFLALNWNKVTAAIGAAWTWLWTTVLQPVFQAIGAIFTWIYQTIILPIVTGIMLYIGLWAAVITWLWQTVLQPVFQAIGQVFTWLYQNVVLPVVGYINIALQALGQIFTWLYQNAIKPALDAAGAAFSWIYQNVIRPVGSFIGDALRNIGTTVHDVFGGVASFIGSAFQAALNVVRGPINGIISLVNSAIDGLNSLHVTIPGWVPIVGGQTWGLAIPHIPKLATGTVTSGPMLAVIGDNPGGREVVSPLDAYQDELRRAYTIGMTSTGGQGAGPVDLSDRSLRLLGQVILDGITRGGTKAVLDSL